MGTSALKSLRRPRSGWREGADGSGLKLPMPLFLFRLVERPFRSVLEQAHRRPFLHSKKTQPLAYVSQNYARSPENQGENHLFFIPDEDNYRNHHFTNVLLLSAELKSLWGLCRPAVLG